MVTGQAYAGPDDCRRVPNILILFDASGYMKEKNRYDSFLTQMGYFVEALPLTADGFFNVGLRHYGLKVGLGCHNTESILAIQPWDPERFSNSFPKTVSYGVSSLSEGLKAAAEDAAAANGKTVILLVGGGVESCNMDPIKTTDQIVMNNPDVEIHAFQIGNSHDGGFFLRGVAERGRGTFMELDRFNSSAGWYTWMKKNLVTACPQAVGRPAAVPAKAIGPIIFEPNSSAVRSRDPGVDTNNLANLEAVGSALRSSPSTKAVLHGYPDGQGNPKQTAKLAGKRAEAVVQYLIKSYRIAPSQLSIMAHTSPKPQVPGGPPQPGVRMVEFEISQ